MKPPSLRHRLEYAGYRLLVSFVRLLPEGVAEGLGGGLGWLAGAVFRIRRADVERHLSIAFPDRPPEWRKRVALASYVHLGRESVAVLRLSGMGAAEIVRRTDVEGLDALEEALRGGGALGVTGHLGNWEIGGAALAARGVPVDAVALGQGNPLFDRDLLAARHRLGMTVIDRGEAPRKVLRSIRGGRLPALVADQNPREGGILVEFFGREASTARGPALFALRTEVPVFLGVALRLEGRPARYRVVLEPVRAERTGELEEDVRRLTRAYLARLEHWIVQAPEQYFWHHRRWKRRPALAPSGGDAEPASGP